MHSNSKSLSISPDWMDSPFLKRPQILEVYECILYRNTYNSEKVTSISSRITLLINSKKRSESKSTANKVLISYYFYWNKYFNSHISLIIESSKARLYSILPIIYISFAFSFTSYAEYNWISFISCFPYSSPMCWCFYLH